MLAKHAGLHVSGLSAGGICVSAYHAINSELDPAPLLESLAEQGARLALPVLLDRDTMVFRQWDGMKPMTPAGFGTLGPDADHPEVQPDLILAPLAAFSATGQRIGYGKGHYDRALSKMHAQGHFPAYVGLAFDQQEVPPFETEPHDIALHGVLTPSGLRIFDHGHEALAPFLAPS
jgi:5-formyltetrahydrofolate cyclo-ligase